MTIDGASMLTMAGSGAGRSAAGRHSGGTAGDPGRAYHPRAGRVSSPWSMHCCSLTWAARLPIPALAVIAFTASPARTAPEAQKVL